MKLKKKAHFVIDPLTLLQITKHIDANKKKVKK